MSTAWAQAPGGPGGSIFETRPSDRRPPLPPYEKPEEVPLEVPKKPALEPKALPYAIRVFIREFRITGNTVIPTDELKIGRAHV